MVQLKMHYYGKICLFPYLYDLYVAQNIGVKMHLHNKYYTHKG